MRNKLFAAGKMKNGDYRFSIWKLGHPSTLLKTYTYKSGIYRKDIRRVKWSERFLLLETNSDILTLVSIETIKWVPLAYGGCVYVVELVFYFCYFYYNGIVRVWDADSATYFSDVRSPFPNKDKSDFEFLRNKICVNSKFVFIGCKYRNQNESLIYNSCKFQILWRC